MAIMPQQFFFADNVRMYAFCGVLSLWLWDRLELLLEAPEAARTRRLAGIAALGVVLTLSHGLGFFVTFFIFFQALFRLALAAWRAGERPLGGVPAQLAITYAIVAVFSTYSLVIASFRGTVGVETLTLDAVGINFALMLLGHEFPAPEISGLVAAAVFFMPPLLISRSRGVMLWLLILPLATLLALSLAVKPVFSFRTIGLFQPFLTIALALAADALMRREPALRGAVAALGLAVAGSAVNHSLGYEKSGYESLAAAWEERAPPDAIFVSPGMSHFWGFTRYLKDVGRDSALEVQPPVRAGMLALKSRIEGTIFDRLGFFGNTDRLEVGGRTYLTHPVDEPWMAGRELWLIKAQKEDCTDFDRASAEELWDHSLQLQVCR